MNGCVCATAHDFIISTRVCLHLFFCLSCLSMCVYAAIRLYISESLFYFSIQILMSVLNIFIRATLNSSSIICLLKLSSLSPFHRIMSTWKSKIYTYEWQNKLLLFTASLFFPSLRLILRLFVILSLSLWLSLHTIFLFVCPSLSFDGAMNWPMFVPNGLVRKAANNHKSSFNITFGVCTSHGTVGE